MKTSREYLEALAFPQPFENRHQFSKTNPEKTMARQYAHITMRIISKSSRYYLFSITMLILLLLNLYAVKALIIFGSPILFSIALFVEVILIGILIYSLVRSLATPKNIVTSLALSIWGGLATNDYIKKINKSQLPLLVWLRRRIKRDSPFGLPLTITLLIAVFFLANFLNVLIAVSSKGSLTHIDTRVLNLIPSIRTPAQTTFFRVVTTLTNIETTILLVVTMTAILWHKHQRLLAGLVLVVATGEESAT